VDISNYRAEFHENKLMLPNRAVSGNIVPYIFKEIEVTLQWNTLIEHSLIKSSDIIVTNVANLGASIIGIVREHNIVEILGKFPIAFLTSFWAIKIHPVESSNRLSSNFSYPIDCSVRLKFIQ